MTCSEGPSTSVTSPFGEASQAVPDNSCTWDGR